MDEKVIEKNEEVEIDLKRIFNALINKAWLICIVSVLCAVLTLVGTFFLVTPKYTSSVMFYVNNSSLSLGDMSMSITSADISASRGLVKTYIVILNTRATINDVIDYAGVNRTYGSVKGMIAAESVNSTEIFQVTITSEDPQEAEKIASAIAYVLPKRIDSIMNGTSAKIVDSAVIASSPSSPNYSKNTVIGFLAGMLAVCGLIVLFEIFDITIRNEEDITRVSKYPVLAAVPNMESQSKGKRSGYYYGYKKPYAKAASDDGTKTVLIGDGISFAASEAYKLLRTKLQFSFADDNDCHIIGISSALTGEGKSLTAVNLSYSMAQLGKRVLLIDCDMRRPSIAEKLNIQKAPGLSEFLSGQIREDNLIQYCGLQEDAEAFHVISAGHVPPNPMELLSSKRMVKTLQSLRANYDYVILDLPPVSEVGDALAIAGKTDGMLLVVRQDYCNRLALNATLRQFEFIDSRILGNVFNCTVEDTAGYGYKYLRRYYRRYGYYRKYYHRYSARSPYAHPKVKNREEK
jgi:capsular exopolysaccharide synthesis family protein